MENEVRKWKEKKWKELQACKFFCQKIALQDVRKQPQDMHEKYNKLKEDFVYNLRILEERDKELEHYDAMITHLKASENAKKAEISDLRIQLDELEQALVKERKKQEEMYHYQPNHKDHKLQLEWSCRFKNSRIGHQCEDCLSLKHVMERKLQELEGELVCQKQELESEFDAEMKRQECEFRQQTNKMSNLVLSHEAKIFQCDDKSSPKKDFPTSEIQKLQDDNDNLRAIIAQMRKEMESLNEQMLPSCPQTENRQLAEQTSTGITTKMSEVSSGRELEWDEGSSYTDEVSTGTTLNNIEMSSANLDLVVKPHKEKERKPKVLKERMVDHLQNLSDVGLSDSLPYGMGCSLLGMQNKLKEAMRKILILSQEKQQLIEMGNKLRTELGMVSKEGFRLPDGSKCYTVYVASGSLFPKEFVKRAQCQLSALERLQDKLATQIQLDSVIENCGAAQQKACTSSALIESQPLGESPSQAQQVWLSSSRTRSSCQDTWHALETRSSPSVLSPQNNSGQGVEFQVIYATKMPEEFQQNIKAKDKAEMPPTYLTVTGAKLEVQQKVKSRNLSCAHPIKPKISFNMAKIRNYNIKE